MKKVLISIILLSMLALMFMPMNTISVASKPNLKFAVTPIQEQFVEESTGEPLPAVPGYYLGYDIDVVTRILRERR